MNSIRKYIFFVFLAVIACAPCCFSENDNSDIEKNYKEGVASFRNKEWEKAYDSFTKVFQARPEYRKLKNYYERTRENLSDNYYDSAALIYSPEKIDGSIAYLRKAAEVYPESRGKFEKKMADLYFKTASAAAEKDYIDDAVSYYHRAAQMNVELQDKCDRQIADLYHVAGVQHFNKNKYEHALDSFQFALRYERERNVRRKINSFIAQCKTFLAKQYFETGRNFEKQDNLIESLKHYYKAAEMDRNYPELDKRIKNVRSRAGGKAKELYLEGLRAYDQGNVRKAIEMWENTLVYEPDNLKARTSLERTKAELNRR